MFRPAICSAAALVLAGLAAAAAEMDLGDAKLSYVDEGQGAPVLFVHGAISDMRAWDPYREMIAADYRFIAYTQRYFGTGDWPDSAEGFQRQTHIDDLIAFVEGLDAGPVNLVTWSYSGEVGVMAMLARPDLFNAAIHYEPTVERLVAGVPGGDNASRKLFSQFGPAVAAAQEGRAEDAALRFIEVVFQLPEGKAVGESGEQMWRENGRTVMPFISMAPPAMIDCATLGRITAPTLVVQGTETYTQDSIMAEQVAGCVGNGMTLPLAGANHDGPYRQPEAFGAMITGFLSLVSPASGS